MCGIWGFLNSLCSKNECKLFNAFMKIKNRGPDRSTYISDETMSLGFHRLAIMDTSINGDQPFKHTYVIGDVLKTVYLMCNGEIYNYRDMKKSYDTSPELKSKYTLTSSSDCEIIMPYFLSYGIECISRLLEGEYAFSIIVTNQDLKSKAINYEVYLCRDRFGIRPLFYSHNEYTLMFCSEMKGLIDISFGNEIKVFPPRTWIKFSFGESEKIKEEYVHLYYNLKIIESFGERDINSHCKIIRKELYRAVESRLQSDREVGCLLSGGLDSSLISAISSRMLNKKGIKLNTFSIGMPDSPDAIYADLVSKHIQSNHINISIPEEEWLKTLEEIIRITETYDVTTIRATTGQYLISKWISENTNIKVLLIGDGSDELTSGYLYFHIAPSAIESHHENIKLLENIHYFDVLRADRGVSSNGLEARVPFLSKDFVETYLSINKELRIPTIENNVKSEKWLLRKAFDRTNLLPKEVLWRRKEAFSDGVSKNTRSWYQIIQEIIESEMSDDYFNTHSRKYGNVIPQSKEALYYIEIFNKYYPEQYNILPYYWMPNWAKDTKDPSARTLKIYND